MRLANQFRLITAIHILLPLLIMGITASRNGLLEESLFQDVLGIALISAFFIIFFSPETPGIKWMVTTPLSRIMVFCRRLQDEKDPHFSLPPQKEDENEFITLMRHMNWMARKIRIRESELEERVQERTLALETAYHQLEEARDAAEASSRAKDGFLATMSHEIRTPIHAISGMCDVLLRSSVTPAQSEHLRIIQTASKALLDQMNATLDFSRISAGRLPLNEAPFRIRELVEDVCAIFAGQAGKKEIELIADVRENVPACVTGDGPRIRQVLINLMGNALKFTESGDICLKVHFDPATERTVFEVKDTGMGIALRHQKEIFLPFTQADGSITRRYGGTGLGLAICRGIIRQMGGHMTLDSKEGRGSTFSFSLALPVQPVTHTRPPLPERLQRLHCLVAEDHPVTARVLGRYLKDFGFSFHHADTGQKLLDTLKEAPHPDLILLDIRLRDTDGLALCRKLAQDHDPLPPVILMGSRPDEEGVAMASPGCTAFLNKPLRPSTLFDTIMEIFGADLRVRPCPAPAGPENLRGLRILLVEDNSVNRMIARELLIPAGVCVHTASSGAEALVFLEREEVDIILMDVRMEGMDGRATTRKIRSLPKWRNIPIIALTADAGMEEESLSRMAGMDGHLTKPLNAQALFSMLAGYQKNSGKNAPMPATHRRPSGQPHPDGTPLDSHGVIHRFLGNRQLYEKVLEEFARNQSETPEKIKNSLGRGDKENARLLAHTLKGTAANIGAHGLSAAAKTVETAILQDTGKEPLEEGLSLLSQSMDAVLEAIEKNIPSANGPSPESGTAPLPEVLSALGELDGLFAANRMNAKAKTAELENLLSGCGRAMDFRKLMDAAERYDFQNARSILQQIQASLSAAFQENHQGVHP
ncbi:signal transduction histidine kinase [Desulfobotulus alkaliphilus]|uniref:histidine kinase n=1 Tax=Desulfobotulus alkaliphilus TaxID=622671 RepID=A0A562RE48_9BACT|nr:response regulator [Desulfobotulus alkaliphilus]TWI66660.1 signal transduction histidine kinase [Desulfobotulus alkaliphilus]